MGTSHVLDIIRDLPNRCACVCITTDKVYKPNSYQKSFKEENAYANLSTGIDTYHERDGYNQAAFGVG